MRRRRRLWITLLAAPLVLLAADTLYWQIAASRLDEGFRAWVAWRRSEGWTADTGKPQHGGWPLAATLTVPGVSLQGGDPAVPGGLSWHADRVLLRVSLLRPGTLDVSAGGAQQLRLGKNPPITYTAGRMHLIMPLEAAVLPPFVDFAAQDLRASVPATGDTATVGTRRAHLEFNPAARSGEPALGFSLKADTISPPRMASRVLGASIASVSIDGALDGPVPLARTLAETAAGWRDGGGSLEVQHLAVNWGPLDLTASATLALDDQLQPMGTGNARVVGYADTLDALATHGVISKSAATAAKAVLSLLANSPDDGSPPDVEVPLTLQYRTLSMRQIPLVRLPELDWE
jgi:hypothetical protein